MIHREEQAAEVRLTADRRDQRGDDVGHERGDHRGEGGADDDGDRRVDHIAAGDEVPEPLNTRISPWS